MLSIRLVQNLRLAKFAQQCKAFPAVQQKINFVTNNIAKVTSRKEPNLENWMNELRSELKTIPIINLAIPGSHDSMTYGINKNSTVAPDAEEIIKYLYSFFPEVVRNWSITQSLTAKEQLENGIRYFDLRICLNDIDKRYYFTHGLYCDEITYPFIEINEFLESHPNEFVILDCQHFYAFAPSDYVKLAEKIKNMFGNKFYTKMDGDLKNLTLNLANTTKKQILMIYRNSLHVPSEFWQTHYYPTPWADTIDVNELRTYLTRTLSDRSPHTGFISQCVLTPTSQYIIDRLFQSIETTVAPTVLYDLSDWIMKQKPGAFDGAEQPTANVFIADFVNLQSNKFINMILDLNNKIVVSK